MGDSSRLVYNPNSSNGGFLQTCIYNPNPPIEDSSRLVYNPNPPMGDSSRLVYNPNPCI